MLVNRTMKRCARGKVCFTRDNPVRNKKKKKKWFTFCQHDCYFSHLMQKVYSVTERTLAQKFVYYKGNEICPQRVSDRSRMHFILSQDHDFLTQCMWSMYQTDCYPKWKRLFAPGPVLSAQMNQSVSQLQILTFSKQRKENVKSSTLSQHNVVSFLKPCLAACISVVVRSYPLKFTPGVSF